VGWFHCNVSSIIILTMTIHVQGKSDALVMVIVEHECNVWK
jgi:hypothetical protein